MKNILIGLGKVGTIVKDVLVSNNVDVKTVNNGSCEIIDGDCYLFTLPTIKEAMDVVGKCELEGKVVVNLTSATIEQTLELAKCLEEKKAEFISGAIICQRDRIGTDESYISYSGKKETYEKIAEITKALGGAHYEGENIMETSLMEFTSTGVHYTGIMAIYTGIAMCKKYGFDFGTYLYHTLLSMPSLSEAAYRSVWDDFRAESDFSDVDDVIHATEMLCCLLKKTGGKELLFDNKEIQKELENILHEHWDSLMSRYESMADKKEGGNA